MANAFQTNVLQAPDVKRNSPVAIALNDEDITKIKSTGDVLNNRFELLECIGTGAMSSVYKAIDRRKVEARDRHPHVAVKVLNVEFRTHPKSLVALQREAKKCQSLAHPNIVQVYDFDRDDKTVYMTMEYLSGITLGRLMRDPYFTGIARGEALRIINDAGHALSFAHNAGIVHADFKPANVFITNDGRIKVIDFGIARAFQRDEEFAMDATCFDPRILQTLTPTYSSPQMLENKNPDPRDDIFALACTAYEMLTGRHPFGRVPSNAAYETGLKLAWHNLLTRSQYAALKHALEFDRDKRTATIEQFLLEINRTSKIIGKSATALGFVALIVGASTSQYYFSDPSKDVSTKIATGDGHSTNNATIKTNFVSFAPSTELAKPNGLNTTIEQTSLSPMSASADLELKFDLTFWESIKDGRLAEYQAYLEAFPNGHFASDARLRIAQLTQVAKAPRPQPEVLAYTDLEQKFDHTFWESIQDGKLAEYQAYLEAFPNGHFAADARLRIAQLTQVAKAPRPQPEVLANTDLEHKFDHTFWESIHDGKLAEYQAYLKAFPNGHFASDARLRIAQLKRAVEMPKSRAQKISKIVSEDAAKYRFSAMLEAPLQAVEPRPPRFEKKTKSTYREIVGLLTMADVHFNADRLMAPKFNNALFLYQKVLELSADNPDALAGIERIKAKLLGYASDALAKNDLETARSQLKKVLVIDPQDKEAHTAIAKL